jgi:hypothetical protein
MTIIGLCGRSLAGKISANQLELPVATFASGKEFTMIDEMTKDQLRVSTDGIGGPYLMIPVPQLDAVRAVIDRHHIPYWVDADGISLDGEPAITVINFGRSGEVDRIQSILDEAG